MNVPVWIQHPCFAASFLRRVVSAYGVEDEDLAKLAALLVDDEIEAVRTMQARVQSTLQGAA